MITKSGSLLNSNVLMPTIPVLGAMLGYKRVADLDKDQKKAIDLYYGGAVPKKISNAASGAIGAAGTALPGAIIGSLIGHHFGIENVGKNIGAVLGGAYGAHRSTSDYSIKNADRLLHVAKSMNNNSMVTGG